MEEEGLMAGRPPLPIGTAGEFSKPRETTPGSWLVSCQFRDTDGMTRRVRATGPTAAKAKSALAEKIRDRKKQHSSTEELTSESPLSALVDRWLETLEPKRRSVTDTREGSLSDDTVDSYARACQNIIKPELGAVRLRELNTQRVDNYLSGRTTRRREVRIILGMVCKLGVRWNLLEYNPVRETEAPPRPKSDKRVLTPSDVKTLIERTREWQARKPGESGPKRGHDLLEIVTLLMATGERIGEVLALRWGRHQVSGRRDPARSGDHRRDRG